MLLLPDSIITRRRAQGGNMGNKWFWLLVSGLVLYSVFESAKKSYGEPLLPGIQPGGCLPGDPSVTLPGGKTYCLPQGVILY